MTIRFACKHCGAVSDVGEEYSGQSGPCVSCGQTITIPLSAGTQVVPNRSTSVGVIVAFLVGGIGVLVVCGGILAALLLPAVQAAPEAARRAACANNLKQISVAMLQYQDAHGGNLPPAYVADKNGKPMHSWRVLLLPYLEEGGFFDQYRMDEPWDSPNNAALAMAMPQVYRCLSDSAGPNETSYALITGSGLLFDGDKTPKKPSDPSRTLLVVEAAGNKINWMAPIDIDADKISLQLNDPSGNAVRSRHPGVINAAYCDGHVESLTTPLDPDMLKAMAMPDVKAEGGF